jgi:hypothetical protein
MQGVERCLVAFHGRVSAGFRDAVRKVSEFEESGSTHSSEKVSRACQQGIAGNKSGSQKSRCVEEGSVMHCAFSLMVLGNFGDVQGVGP